MGSKSWRSRADSELVYLYLFLFLCLGFLSRPADYGHTFPSVYRGALNLEQGSSEILATANPGAFVKEQGTSEVIALANSARSVSNKFGSIGKSPVSAADYLDQKEREMATMQFSGEFNSANCHRRSDLLKVNSSRDVLASFRFDTNVTDFLDLSYNQFQDLSHNQFQGPLPNLTRISFLRSVVDTDGGLRIFPFDSDLGTSDGTSFWYGVQIEHPKWTLSQSYLGSGNEFSEINPQRRPWFMVRGMEQIELVIDYKIPKGTSTESPLNLPSSAICLDSVQKILFTLLRDKTNEVMGVIKKLCHTEKCSSDRGFSLRNDLELRTKVISIILAGITIFVILLTMGWKRMRNVIVFKSDNELDALILEESDFDKSYLADQILYENLLKEAELVSDQGSSGKVFKVRFLELECAMKVFHSSARMDFRKESITLQNLSHPHIVKFFCSFRKSFIIMELMDEDLYSFLTKIRERRIDYDMPLEVALDVMLQIAEGMSYLHHQGIAHQDLKSLNILLKLRGEFDDPDFQILAKVADLGSARRFNPRSPKGFVLFPKMNIGTRSWRAPELFHPRGGFLTRFLGVNPRVLPKPLDTYGFAVICSELLTKQIPFSDDKDLRLAVLGSKLREGHRPALPSTGCPEGLLALIKDCWHQDPVLRPEFHEICTRLIEVNSSCMFSGQRRES